MRRSQQSRNDDNLRGGDELLADTLRGTAAARAKRGARARAGGDELLRPRLWDLRPLLLRAAAAGLRRGLAARLAYAGIT